MAIYSHVHKQTGCIHIDGRFDFLVHREFKKAYMAMLDNPTIQEIEVNMRQLDFIDSAALGMLMLLRERAQAANKSIVLSNPSEHVSMLLWVASFHKLFAISGFNESKYA
ncbi:MAG TPA: STAS domain-containing protein [Sideroxyarcus sp.]|nr:STAS domain-containing protein [Sideroxyarcus sp.]